MSVTLQITVLLQWLTPTHTTTVFLSLSSLVHVYMHNTPCSISLCVRGDAYFVARSHCSRFTEHKNHLSLHSPLYSIRGSVLFVTSQHTSSSQQFPEYSVHVCCLPSLQATVWRGEYNHVATAQAPPTSQHHE
jgi:hypothetical protein